MAKVEAIWSGTYPCLCFGEWTLKINGQDMSNKIPEDLRGNSMHTLGTYSKWHFEDWQEVFEDYEDGLDCDDWIKENSYWLDNITKDKELQQEIFYAIQSHDFRSGSCGGCI